MRQGRAYFETCFRCDAEEEGRSSSLEKFVSESLPDLRFAEKVSFVIAQAHPLLTIVSAEKSCLNDNERSSSSSSS
ncbi:unnamed protein product, partial [Amoebophrya sp. A25]|eukprot:GSA25T00017221001.1